MKGDHPPAQPNRETIVAKRAIAVAEVFAVPGVPMSPRRSIPRHARAEPGHLRSLLASHPLLAAIPEARRARLLAEEGLLYLDSGEALYRAGEPADAVFALLEGALQIEYPRPRAVRGPVAALIASPGLLGESQLLTDKPWSGTGVAVTPLVVLAMSRGTFEELLRTQGQFALLAYHELCGRFGGAIEAWKHGQKVAPGIALARYLLSLEEALRLTGRALGATTDTLPILQAQLAQATGLRRETVNRVLKTWEKRGWLKLGPKGVKHISSEALVSLLPEAEPAPLLRRLIVPTVP